MNHLFRFILITLLATTLYSCQTNTQTQPPLSVEMIATLPELNAGESNFGVAGSFIGVIDNQIIVAGGSNFSKKFPWDGGAKQFLNDIYSIKVDDSGYKVELLDYVKFPGAGIAHGITGVVDNNIYCFGGTTSDSQSAEYYVIKSENDTISIHHKGTMPTAFSPVAASVDGVDIYIHGTTERENTLYKYTTTTNQWHKLTSLPSKTLSAGAVFVAQSSGSEVAHYLISGRDANGKELTLYSDVWEYSPTNDTWSRKGDIKANEAPHYRVYTSAVARGDNEIVVIGGDDGEIFTTLYNLEQQIQATENEEEKAELKAKQRNIQTNHPGFNKTVLLYNTHTNQWSEIASLDIALPVVTTAVTFQDNIIIPSGEISPGVRTPNVYKVELNF